MVAHWITALRDAEYIRATLQPSYQAHTDAELAVLVQDALLTRRDPRELLAQVLG